MIGEVVHRLLPLFALALNLVLLAAALASDRHNRRHRTFAAVAAAQAVWNAAVFALRSTTDPTAALQWERLLHVAVALLPALFYHYVLAFLNVRARRASLAAAYGLAGLFIAVTPTAWFMSGVRSTAWGFAPVVGPAYAAFLVYFHAYLLLGLGWLIAASQLIQAGSYQKRARWIISGVLVSLTGGFVDFARFTVGPETLYPIGIPANAVFALALGVAVVRYRLIDIGVLLRRALLYGLTSLALAPLIFAAIALSPPIGGEGQSLWTALSAPLIAVVATALAMPLLRKLERLIERIIFHREHGVRDALVRLSTEMPRVIDLRQLGTSLTRDLVTDVPTRQASFYVRAPGTDRYEIFERCTAPDDDAQALLDAMLADGLVRWLASTLKPFVLEDAIFRATAEDELGATVRALQAAHVAVILPIVQDDSLEAVLVVGEKRSGDGFDHDEVELLQALAGNTSIALKNARLYDALRRRMEELQATQQQLTQSAKLAAIGELAASVAHEVNNPLMVIMGHAGLLSRELTLIPAAQSRLDAISEQTNRASKIIQDLLDFARRREPRPEPIDVTDVVKRSSELVAGKLRSQGIVSDEEVVGIVPLVIGDRDQLTQVFVNLLSNAIDAMPDGGRVSLRTEVRMADGIRCVSITVSDTGVGMTEEQLVRVFEPFYTTKPEGKGTGLGLAVSAGIVRKHEGTIEVVSEPGKGTSFTVSLPIADG